MSDKFIALTVGEPAGIGPDIVLQLAPHHSLNNIVAIADRELLSARAKQLSLSVQFLDYQTIKNSPRVCLPEKNFLILDHFPLNTVCQPGVLNKENVAFVLQILEQTVQRCLQQEFKAMVTGPVHKGIINDSGIAFTGQTEFIAKRCGVANPVMLLANRQIKVALVTTHLPLKRVSSAITAENLSHTLQIVNQDLINRFAIAKPRIAVCGLNPHAGEGGYLGREEIEIIAPTIAQLQKQSMNVWGPIAADTAFIPQNREKYDVLVAMYHDQGLTALKALGFDEGVNMTLGLPIIRTSVDHGTALELAGSGKTSFSSLRYAMDLARSLSQSAALASR